MGDLTNLRSPAIPDGTPHIIMAGIVNFGFDGSNHILLPTYAFALRLDWHGLEIGHFTPSGNVYIHSGQPICFELKSKMGYRIPKARLQKLGVQLVSMYL